MATAPLVIGLVSVLLLFVGSLTKQPPVALVGFALLLTYGVWARPFHRPSSSSRLHPVLQGRLLLGAALLLLLLSVAVEPSLLTRSPDTTAGSLLFVLSIAALAVWALSSTRWFDRWFGGRR